MYFRLLKSSEGLHYRFEYRNRHKHQLHRGHIARERSPLPVRLARCAALLTSCSDTMTASFPDYERDIGGMATVHYSGLRARQMHRGPGRHHNIPIWRAERAKQNITMTSLHSFLLSLMIVAAALALVPSTHAASRFASSGGSHQAKNRNNYRRLHELLSIGDDPNEDIRTNILLNMEGI